MVYSERVKYWLSVGAQMSDRCAWLFGQVGIIPRMPNKVSVQNALPKEIRKMNKAAAAKK